MQKRGLMVLTMMLAVLGMQANEVTYDFMKSIPSPWVASATPNGFETSDLARGTQFTTNATLTLSGVKDVTKVEIVCSSNRDVNTMSVSMGGNTWKTVTLAKENHATQVFEGSSASGDLVITITRKEKSIWIEKVIVTGDIDDEGGNDDDKPEPLDEYWEYDEPTILTAPAAIGSNVSYSFIKENVRVTTSTGAVTDTYFGCNAGQDITFETTREMKGIVIEGMVKKGFDAEADNGTLSFLSNDEEDIDSCIVLIVKDIDSKTLTLSCVKQLRCYNVRIYFEENPEAEIYSGDDYNFDWEPEEKQSFDMVFTEIEYEDYSEYLGYDCLDIYFDNDDYELELMVFAPAVEGTILAPGIYEINDTYEDGTIQASPGGDDEYDYPSVLMTDFIYYEEYDVWQYNTCYYLESGTLKVEAIEGGVRMTIDATSHNGSTLHATYTTEGADAIQLPHADENPTILTGTDTIKVLENGRISIRHQDKTWNINGTPWLQ